MFLVNGIELALHACSLLTAIVVVSKVILYDKINSVAKVCVSMIYSSVFLTDISYIYAICLKMNKGQILVAYSDIISLEPSPLHDAIFCHEMGTWIYVWGVILTATERLLNGHCSVNPRLSYGLAVASPFLGALIFSSSYFFTSLLISTEYQQHAACIIAMSQVFGISALCWTLVLNQKNYKKGIGRQSLETRYQSAYEYKFNRSLLKSLIGEVLFRALAFSFVAVITAGVHSDPEFGWLALTYHSTISIGSILCPWFIVLRHVKFKQLIFGIDTRVAAVSDLNGNRIALRETSDEHFASLYKAWNEAKK